VQLTTARPGSAIGGDPATVFDAVPIPGAPAGDVDLYVKKPVFRAAFANDLPRKTGRVLAAVQRPVAFSALVTPSGVPAWKTIPSWYFVGTADNVIPPAEQRFERNVGALIEHRRARGRPIVFVRHDSCASSSTRRTRSTVPIPPGTSSPPRNSPA
jgi:hypothetical protein